MITNSSFIAQPRNSDLSYSSVRIFPQFRNVRHIPNTTEAVETLVRQFLLPNGQHPENALDFKPPNPHEPDIYEVADITVPHILICGHSSRDSRCGITGPLLHSEFRRHSSSVRHPHKFPGARRPALISQTSQTSLPFPDFRAPRARYNISTTSHIGGHAFAGNVIIYIPPHWRLPDGKTSPLAGKGIWYGRVEPKHVEGITEETIVWGKVIKELFRGGVGQGGQILRL